MSNEQNQYMQYYPYYYYSPSNQPSSQPVTPQVYYPNYTQRQYPSPQPQPQNTQRQVAGQPGIDVEGMLPIQQSYIENILRLNKGKQVIVHMTFEGNNRQTFTGVIEAAGRDHIIISDPETDKRYLLLMIYLDYVEFDEEINYKYPFDGTSQNLLANYPPR